MEQQIESSETDQIVINEADKDKQQSEDHRFVQNGEAGRPENRNRSGNPIEGAGTGEVKDEPKSDDHELSPQHQHHRNSDAKNFDKRFSPVIVRRLRTWAESLDSNHLNAAERGNISNSSDSRKRVRDVAILT